MQLATSFFDKTLALKGIKRTMPLWLVHFVIWVLAMPVMVAEFVIGRASRSNTVGSYRVLAPGKPWVVSGFLGVLGGFMVLSYYSVVAGWTLDYAFESISGGLLAHTDYGAVFNDFVSSPWRPVVFLGIFLLVTHCVVAAGVEKGIERFSKVLMPLLLLIIFVLIGFSISMPNASTGISFLLKPDFSKVTKDVILSAMGQAFFSLSVAFTLITLPVEFNASHRAIDRLVDDGFLASDEIGGAKKVLSAAAMTYVAAAFAAIAELLRLLAIFGRRDD